MSNILQNKLKKYWKEEYQKILEKHFLKFFLNFYKDDELLKRGFSKSKKELTETYSRGLVLLVLIFAGRKKWYFGHKNLCKSIVFELLPALIFANGQWAEVLFCNTRGSNFVIMILQCSLATIFIWGKQETDV